MARLQLQVQRAVSKLPNNILNVQYALSSLDAELMDLTRVGLQFKHLLSPTCVFVEFRFTLVITNSSSDLRLFYELSKKVYIVCVCAWREKFISIFGHIFVNTPTCLMTWTALFCISLFVNSYMRSLQTGLTCQSVSWPLFTVLDCMTVPSLRTFGRTSSTKAWQLLKSPDCYFCFLFASALFFDL